MRHYRILCFTDDIVLYYMYTLWMQALQADFGRFFNGLASWIYYNY